MSSLLFVAFGVARAQIFFQRIEQEDILFCHNRLRLRSEFRRPHFFRPHQSFL